MTYQIVYARADKTALVPTGRFVLKDMNYFPEFKAEWEGKAGMYLKKGTDADYEKALKVMNADGWKVFKFDAKEKEPLIKAREMVVAEAKLSQSKD